MSPRRAELEEAFQGRKVLITGGLGFIGSTLARRLIDVNADVCLIDSLIPEYGGNPFNIAGIEDRVRVNVSDVRDAHSMRYLVHDRDYLFNLAGQTSHLDSMRDPYSDLDINCRAQLSILESCRQYNPAIKIVFASTRQVYGRPEYLPVDERHPLHPVDVNGINKMAGEWYHILYSDVHDVWACALRLTNTYGPRMRVKDARQTFLGIWIRSLVEARPFDVWDGAQLRDFTYVDDVADAFLRIALYPPARGQVFNLGGLEVVSLKALADALVEANGGGEYRLQPFPADRKRIDIGSYHANGRRIEEAVGWRPRVSLQPGLAATLAFYRQHLGRYL
ncbi:MAG TPA: NAD-dependent epimerase/dehydratase family protein [Methylomirabilota bacterium]